MLCMPHLLGSIGVGLPKPTLIKSFLWLGYLPRVRWDVGLRKIEPEAQAFAAGTLNRLLDVKPLMGCITLPCSGEDSTGRTALQILGQLLKHYLPGMAP